MREHGGRTVATPIESTDKETVQTAIRQHVEVGSTLHTDEAGAYAGIGDSGFSHDAVNHSAGEYVRDNVTTNGIESVFAVLNRGLIGVYHHASSKHLGHYVDEFSFGLNEGNVKNHTLTRLDAFVDGVAGKRLTVQEAHAMNAPKPPKELDAIADVVLAYRPKPKTKPAKKRRKVKKRIIAAQASGESKNNLRKID